jgi:hypothetical protein
MAISVDTVYRTVLLILNSEQRGYMTPDEFNKIGTQVQRQIFERYFEDLNQQVRIPQSDMEYSDRIAITDEKISEFKTESDAVSTGANTFTLPSDLYRLGSLTYEPSGIMPVEVQRVGRAEFYNIRKSPLTAPTNSKPIYLYEDNKVEVYPSTIVNNIKSQYVKKPTDVRWGYEIGNLGQYTFTDYQYNANDLVSGSTINITTQTNLPLVDPSGGFSPPRNRTNIQATNTSGSGSGATFSVFIDQTNGNTLSVTINSIGTGYNLGDTISFDASLFATTTPVGPNLTVTLLAENMLSSTTRGFNNFDLHNSEQTELILRILLYSGVVINDPSVVQVAAQKIQEEEVNEKS